MDSAHYLWHRHGVDVPVAAVGPPYLQHAAGTGETIKGDVASTDGCEEAVVVLRNAAAAAALGA